LELSGDWQLYSSGASGAQSQALSKWQGLPAGGVVRVKSPSEDDFITIVDPRLEVLLKRSCLKVTTCFQPIYLPNAPNRPSGTDALALALQEVWGLLTGGEYELSMHRVRGAARFSEGVGALRDGRLDLGEAMHSIPKGRYSVAPCKPEANCEPAGDRGKVEFDWDPGSTTLVEIGPRQPGLYEVNLEDRADQGAGRLQISVRILACTPPSYPSARVAFQKVRTSTAKWEDATDTTHAFLRAYLAQLARAGVCMK
jgi:hypothetical protein